MSSLNLYDLEALSDPELERTINCERSTRRVRNFLQSAGFTPRVIWSDNELQTTVISLVDMGGQSVALGSGKGKHHSLGGHAEAIEHFTSTNFRSANRQRHALQDVARQIPFQKDFYIQKLFEDDPEALIRAELFHSLTDEGDYLIPAGYVDPYFFEQPSIVETLGETEETIAKLATANGTSMGLTLEDSVLHGLNECIERHYVSLFCQGILGYSTPSANWKAYDNNNHVSYLRKKNIINDRFGKSVTVFTQTDFGSYVALSVLLDKEDFAIKQIGEGSSLFLPLAIQRSIDELAEMLALRRIVKLEDPETRDIYETLRLIKN